VAIVQDPRSAKQRHTAGPTAARPRVAWLALAHDGPAVELPDQVGSWAVRVVAEPRRFRDLLLAERPRIVVCAQPPADRAVLDLVAGERRRRMSLRAVHLSPPDAVNARLAALDLGFDDALTTTIPAAELAGRLAWLASKVRTRPGPPALLVLGDGLELDLAARELRRDGRVIHLRPKEFGLLALLGSNPGRAYTRQELLDRAWGPERAGGARTVDVHVRWLRAKLEPDPEHPVHLVTVRGVGYRLDATQR
jgi:DNA-binding response OmpR family regulator